MAIDVYLTFKGNCREAIEFYTEIFNTDKADIKTFGELPPDPDFPIPEDAKNLIMHASLSIDGSNVMFSDTFPDYPLTIGNNISLTYHTFDTDKLKSVYEQLIDGGTIEMELEETFWSKLYGKVTDKFGVDWQLNLNEEETAY